MDKKHLQLSPRNENTRESFHTSVIRFDLNEIMQHFSDTLNVIQSLFNVADSLLDSGRETEAKNIWRAQVVFLSGSIDFYMHELTKYGLCKIYEENWDSTDKYNNLEINIKYIEEALKSDNDSEWFLDYVNDCYQTITIESYDAVNEQLHLLGIDIKEVANIAFYVRGDTEKPKDKLKRHLNELFYRRNIIAHQTDRKHEDATEKEISKDDVKQYISDIEKIIKAIDCVAKNK